MKQDAGYEKRVVLRWAREIASLLPENADRRRRVLKLADKIAAKEQAACQVERRSQETSTATA
jgi:hypothetical protein